MQSGRRSAKIAQNDLLKSGSLTRWIKRIKELEQEGELRDGLILFGGGYMDNWGLWWIIREFIRGLRHATSTTSCKNSLSPTQLLHKQVIFRRDDEVEEHVRRADRGHPPNEQTAFEASLDERYSFPPGRSSRIRWWISRVQ